MEQAIQLPAKYMTSKALDAWHLAILLKSDQNNSHSIQVLM